MTRARDVVFLQVGSLGLGGMLGGLSLPSLLRAETDAESAKILRDRSVVFLFMHGGPPQAETFDPKMSAASEYRCFNGEIKNGSAGPDLRCFVGKIGSVGG